MFVSLLVTMALAAEPTPAEPAVVDALGPMPAIAAPRPVVPPSPAAASLANGASVWVVEDPTLPLVSLRVSVPGGAAIDPIGQAGRATLSDELMRHGAGDLDEAAFAELVERHGLELYVETGRETSSISLTCRKADLELGLDLVADLILRPTWDKVALETERALEVAALEQSANEPGVVAARVAQAAWWGEGHPYARPVDGLPADLARLTRKDVKAHHTLAWTPSAATITAAGDVTASGLVAELDRRLAGWKSRPAPSVAVPAPGAHPPAIVAVERAGSAQTTIQVLTRGEAYGSAGSDPLELGAVVLGGTFTSRLNALLREQKGYTYGARAASVELSKGGTVVVSTRVRADVTGAALKDLLAELDRAAAGITDAELTKAQGAWRQDLVATLETRAATADRYAGAHRAGLPPGAVAAEAAAMDTVTKAAVDAALATFAPDRDRVVVLVGDRATIDAQLAEQGLGGLVWLAR